MVSGLQQLVARWLEQAAAYETDAQPGATLLRRVAAELAEALRQHELEELTIAAAADESGYSPSQLRRQFPGRKTVPRRDLPKKARVGGPDLVGTILRKAS